MAITMLDILDFARHAGVAGVLVLLIVAMRRRWLVWGWEFEAAQASLNEWRGLLLTGVVEGEKFQGRPSPEPMRIVTGALGPCDPKTGGAPARTGFLTGRLRPLYQPPADYAGPVCKSCGSAFCWSDDGRCANCGDPEPMNAAKPPEPLGRVGP